MDGEEEFDMEMMNRFVDPTTIDSIDLYGIDLLNDEEEEGGGQQQVVSIKRSGEGGEEDSLRGDGEEERTNGHKKRRTGEKKKREKDVISSASSMNNRPDFTSPSLIRTKSNTARSSPSSSVPSTPNDVLRKSASEIAQDVVSSFKSTKSTSNVTSSTKAHVVVIGLHVFV